MIFSIAMRFGWINTSHKKENILKNYIFGEDNKQLIYFFFSLLSAHSIQKPCIRYNIIILTLPT